MRKFVLVGLALGSAFALGHWGASPGSAYAQPGTPQRVWDVDLGRHVAELPVNYYVEPACGSNGGPPGRPIEAFTQFMVCPVDEATGLREISFVHDDMMEYIARARRDPVMIDRFNVNAFYGQMMISSLLVGNDGLIAGYRFITDSRTDAAARIEAHGLGYVFRSRFGIDGGSCTSFPPANGETPVGGAFVKEKCTKLEDGRQYVVESRLYYKPGQSMLDPFNRRLTQNEFESSARLEVLQIDPPAIGALSRQTIASLGPNAGVAAGQRDMFLAGNSLRCPMCDLSGVDLRRRNLAGADLSGANLEEAILHRADLREARLTGANLRNANLNKADLTFADLQGANLFGAMMFEADASRANFSGSDLRFALMGSIRLILARLDGAVLETTDLEAAQANDARFAGATMTNVNLHKAILIRADLSDLEGLAIYAEDAEFRGANLRFAKFLGSNLLRADLSGADLTGADFTNAWMLSARLTDATLDGTVFAGATMPDNTVGR